MAWGWIEDAEWRAVLRQLNRIESKLNILTTEGRFEMATLQDVLAEVEETKGAVASVTVAVDGFKTHIADLIRQLEEARANAADPAAIDAVIAGLNEAQAGLSALVPAVEANPS